MDSEWKQFTLSKLCHLITDGKHGDCENQEDSGFYFLSVKDVFGNRLNYEQARQITEKDFLETHKRTNLEPGDVLFTNTGTIGRMAIAPEDSKTYRTTFQKSVAILKPNRDFITPRFFYYLLSYDNARLSNFAGGTTQKNLLLKDFRNFPVRIPSLPIQQAIAHILGTLDDKIELNQQMNQTLEAIARALFKSWFIDFDPVRAKLDGRQPIGMDAETAALFPAEFEDSAIGKIPKGWNVGMLRDCCDRVENGGTPKRSESDYWEPGTIPWLTSGEVRQSIVTVTENFISEKGLANSSAKLWTPRTTVVAMYGATAGQVCLLAQKMCTNQACCGLIPAKNKQFFIYLQASNSVELLAQQARGSAQQNLSQKIVGDFPTVIPSDSVLKSFDEYVKSLFEKWIANLEESKSLASARDTLLPKLLSGEIRVQDAETVVEAVT